MFSSKNTHDEDEENEQNSENSLPKTQENIVEKSENRTKELEKLPAQKKYSMPKDSNICQPNQEFQEDFDKNVKEKEEEKGEESEEDRRKTKTDTLDRDKTEKSLLVEVDNSQENQSKAEKDPNNRNKSEYQQIPRTVNAFSNEEEQEEKKPHEKTKKTKTTDRGENENSLKIEEDTSREANNFKFNEKSTEKAVFDPEITNVRSKPSNNSDHKKQNENQQIPKTVTAYPINQTVKQIYQTPIIYTEVIPKTEKKDSSDGFNRRNDSSSFDRKMVTGESSSVSHPEDNYRKTQSSLKTSDERSKKEDENNKKPQKSPNPDNIPKHTAQSPEKSFYGDNEKHIFPSKAETIKFLPKIIKTLRKNPVLIQGDVHYFHLINSNLQKVYQDYENPISLNLMDFEPKMKNVAKKAIKNVYQKIRNIRQVYLF